MRSICVKSIKYWVNDPFVDTSERVNVIKCSADGSVSQENLCEIPGLCLSHSTLSQCGHNVRLRFPYLVCVCVLFVFNGREVSLSSALSIYTCSTYSLLCSHICQINILLSRAVEHTEIKYFRYFNTNLWLDADYSPFLRWQICPNVPNSAF